MTQASDQRRVALITGASSDIGQAIATRLSDCGFQLVLHYFKNEAKTIDLAQKLETKGTSCLCVRADLTEESQIKEAFQNIRSRFGRLDALVNNASLRLDGPLVSLSTKKWDAVFSVVVRGSFLCTKEALLMMCRERFGRIVNISSVSGSIGWPGQANYSSAKAALIGLTKTTAREYASYGITCNAIVPGWIETEATRALTEDQKSALSQRAILQSPGRASEIATWVSHLCDPNSQFITGQSIAVDGGASI